MSKYRLFHTLIVLIFMVFLIYGLLVMNTQGFIMILASGIIGIGMMFLNHGKNKHHKRQKR